MKNKQCIDAGREGCPCALAEYGKCLICGRLSGGSCQDCSWQGTCIYTLFQQNGRQKIDVRRERRLAVHTVRRYSESFCVFLLEADRGFCQKAQTAGAYVFARAEGADPWYDMPVSVLKAEPEKGLIHLGVCGSGPKSGALLQAETAVVVRGIYYNGLCGLGSLDDRTCSASVFARGIAIAPLRNLLDGGGRYRRWLKNAQLYVDTEKVGMDFLRDYFGDLPAGSLHVRSFAEEGAGCGEAEVCGNVFALTSPYYAEQIEEAAEHAVVRPNNANLCCGEGICGACTCDDKNGKTVHRCKAKR